MNSVSETAAPRLTLGPFALTMIGVSSVIGAGIFVISGVTHSDSADERAWHSRRAMNTSSSVETDLPRNWSAADSPSQLREIGQRWLDAGAAAVLKVPSAVVVEEWNCVLNPQHPDFKKLIFQKPKRFQFDRRLARERKS